MTTTFTEQAYAVMAADLHGRLRDLIGAGPLLAIGVEDLEEVLVDVIETGSIEDARAAAAIQDVDVPDVKSVTTGEVLA